MTDAFNHLQGSLVIQDMGPTMPYSRGDLWVQGKFFTSKTGVAPAIAGGAAAITAADIAGGRTVLIDTSTAAVTVTLPTAAAIVAALPQAAVGMALSVTVRAFGSNLNAVTLSAAAAGITCVDPAPATYATISAREAQTFTFVITNVATPAVAIY